MKITMIEKPRTQTIGRKTFLALSQAVLLVSSTAASTLGALAANQSAINEASSAATTSLAAETSASENSEDFRVIRQQAADYAKLYAARDAKGLAAMWTADGTFTDSRGHEHVGRAALEEYFADGFKEELPQTLDIVITSLKQPASGVAIEEGTTRISSGPGMGSMGRYLVVHNKVDGKWLMSTCVETEYSATSNFEYLKDLDWLVGSWSVKEQPQAAHLKVSWSKNKTFLVCRYVVADGKEGTIEELQIIGWNPHTAQINVWHFGAAGGFGYGQLVCDGKNWIERATATEPDGSAGRARYKLTRLDDNSFTWQSTKRAIAGQSLPDSNPLTIVRDRVQ
jgi:uncharacterized protein (TIGR02246 family)